ncbi:MAG: hypothetical protein JW902_18145 [Syntrophaceae bacterium]|nr:hypothetical protein [Syntrophaceae bacterium]
MEMPLRKLQEIIIDYAQHLYDKGRFRAFQFSVDYPYKGPAFAFMFTGDRLEFIDNTQEPATLQDGRKVMEKVDHGKFRKPKRNQVKAAFLKFRYWENKLLTNGSQADPENLDLVFETIADKLLPFAVAILKSTAESYTLLDPTCDSARDAWTHPVCDLTCQSGMLESGESVPAEIQVKAEELNDLLRQLQRRIKRVKTMLSQAALSNSSEASRKLAQLVHEIIVDYAGEMVLAGQHKNADTGKQYPHIPIIKDETNPFPPLTTPMQEATDYAAVPKAKTKNTEITEETSRDEDINPQPNRRNERTNSRKAKTPGSGLSTAAERREAVQAYIDEVFDKTGKRITRTDIWQYARYKNRTEFQRWQRNDPKATRTANERFTRILKEKPHLK